MKKRIVWMDVMRPLCAFLVILNHTNSKIFISTAPSSNSWWISLLWYYIGKIAVPVFVLISGACLLGRIDSYAKNARRIVKMSVLLELFSALFYLTNSDVESKSIGDFFTRFWRVDCGDGYWYLFFYIGLLLMLPILQRLRSAMDDKDMRYLIALSFGFGAVLPLVVHYVPALEMTPYFYIPMFSTFIGLFFAGDWLQRQSFKKREAWLALALAAVCLAVSVLLTYAEYKRGNPKYWFMDDRLHPSVFTVLTALSASVIAKVVFASTQEGPMLKEIASCTFGIYLLEEFGIALTYAPVYLPLCSYMPAVFAVLIWDVAAFALCLLVTWLIRRIPFVKRWI